MMATAKPRLYIAYGSESGNAHSLAYELRMRCLGLSPQLLELNELSLALLTELTADDVLLVVTSTTGDGDAPSNARKVYHTLARNQSSKEKIVGSFQFAVFGLGDVNYDNFCGFSIVMDGLLRRIGATALAPRVDADIDFEEFFEQWSGALVAYLKAQDTQVKADTQQVLQALTLQVNPND